MSPTPCTDTRSTGSITTGTIITDNTGDMVRGTGSGISHQEHMPRVETVMDAVDMAMPAPIAAAGFMGTEHHTTGRPLPVTITGADRLTAGQTAVRPTTMEAGQMPPGHPLPPRVMGTGRQITGRTGRLRASPADLLSADLTTPVRASATGPLTPGHTARLKASATGPPTAGRRTRIRASATGHHSAGPIQPARFSRAAPLTADRKPRGRIPATGPLSAGHKVLCRATRQETPAMVTADSATAVSEAATGAGSMMASLWNHPTDGSY